MFREVEAIVGQFEPALGGVGLDESSHHLEQVQQIAAVFGIVDGIGLGKAIPAGAEHAGLVHFAVVGEKESAVCEGAVFQDKVIRLSCPGFTSTSSTLWPCSSSPGVSVRSGRGSRWA